jgi:hypothetical protein
MDPRAAITATDIASDPPDVGDEVAVGDGATALQAPAPGIIAAREISSTRHMSFTGFLEFASG